jgi:16S rRNA (cytidine1402-2'-O)-methyltransferase
LLEAPHRLRATLSDLLAVLGDRRVAVCCELTKLFEYTLRGTLSAAAARYEREAPRGEFTLVVEGASIQTSIPATVPAPSSGEVPLRERFDELFAQLGDRKRALARLAGETGRTRKELYRELMADG